MQDAMLHYIRLAFAAQALRGGPVQARRRPDRSRAATRRAASIPCKGGGPNDYVYVYTSRANPEHWKRLLSVIGREDLIGDPRFEIAGAREQHEAEVNAMVSDWTSRHDKHEAMRVLGAAGIPAGAVLDTMELAEDPTFARARHPADHGAPDGRRVQDAGLAGAPQRRAGRGQAGAAARASTPAKCCEAWLGLERARDRRAEQDKVIVSSASNERAPSRAVTMRIERMEETTMAELTGSEILAKALKKEGTENLFFIMGGPMLLAESSCIKEGIRPIDVRHEQAAALMGQAYSRLLQKPSVCMAASGPGVINLTTGIANALIDCCPVVAIGGSSPISQFGRQVFQEIDQVAIMRGCVKWADRVYNLKRIPEQVNNAFQNAMSGKPGPTYLDFPGDILYAKIPEEQVDWRMSGRPILNARPARRSRAGRCAGAWRWRAPSKPVIVSGSGVIWSRAWAEMQQFVEKAGIPFYTTPQGRGVVPDDHPLSFLTMRSTAFQDADLIIVLGTRMNYIIGHAAPPRFNASAKIARIDIDADEIATAARKVDIGIVGDCRSVLQQLLAGMKGKVDPGPLQGLAQDSWPTARRRSARRPAPTSMSRTATSIRCGCARRSRTSCSATRSWWSTARRS